MQAVSPVSISRPEAIDALDLINSALLKSDPAALRADLRAIRDLIEVNLIASDEAHRQALIAAGVCIRALDTKDCPLGHDWDVDGDNLPRHRSPQAEVLSLSTSGEFISSCFCNAYRWNVSEEHPEHEMGVLGCAYHPTAGEAAATLAERHLDAITVKDPVKAETIVEKVRAKVASERGCCLDPDCTCDGDLATGTGIRPLTVSEKALLFQPAKVEKAPQRWVKDRNSDGSYTVAAWDEARTLHATVTVWKNEAGFRGRQWESQQAKVTDKDGGQWYAWLGDGQHASVAEVGRMLQTMVDHQTEVARIRAQYR